MNNSAILEAPISKESPLDLSSRGGISYFALTSSVILLGASLLHTFIHEMIGHGLFALAIGQRLLGFYITPFGASYTFATLSTLPGLRVLQYAAGTLVSVPLGIFLLTFVYPRLKRNKIRSSFELRLFVLFLVIMLESDLLYGFMSPIVRFGDIYQIALIVSPGAPLELSAALIPAILIMYYFVLREYLELLLPFAERQQLTLKAKARFSFLLKVTYLPVILFLTYQFFFNQIFSGPGYALFIAVGATIMVIPIFPSVYLITRKSPSSQLQKTASITETQLARLGLLQYCVICALFLLLDVLVFGPAIQLASA
jgi:hypothetical protein